MDGGACREDGVCAARAWGGGGVREREGERINLKRKLMQKEII